MLRVDLGGRVNAPEGYKVIDIKPPADYVFNLEAGMPIQLQYACDEIRAHHVLEHIRNLTGLMDSLWESLKPDGILDIIVPHKDHGAAWHDPTHVRYFTCETFDYFTPHLAYFDYVKHYWEYETKPHMVGGNNDCIAVRLKKVL